MSHNDSPPDSPLSSVGSNAPYDEDLTEYDYSALRPSKRQKVQVGSTASSAVVQEAELDTAIADPDVLEGMSDVSSDTSGDIPSSPINARLDEEDFQDQVTICDWDGCPAGDQHNMDRLVRHIHDSHIESRQKKYTCEWMSCNRKGLPHASGYALKAHMRSHTREKPFYCYLPGKMPVLGQLATDLALFFIGIANIYFRVRQVFYKIRRSCQAYANRPRNRSPTTLGSDT